MKANIYLPPSPSRKNNKNYVNSKYTYMVVVDMYRNPKTANDFCAPQIQIISYTIKEKCK